MVSELILKIKILGKEYEGIVLLPSREREHDMVNQYHIWVPVSKKPKKDLIRFLFNEELGGIFAIDKKYEKEFIKLTRKYNLEAITNNIGNITKKGKPMLKITACNYSEPISTLRKYWSEL